MLPDTLPSGHATHEDAPELVTYLPTAQDVHCVAPPPERLPAVQDTQDAAPVPPLYLPAAQAVQDAAPDPEYSPCPQAVQDSRPAALDLPATHEAHRSDDTAAFEASLVAYLPAVHW